MSSFSIAKVVTDKVLEALKSCNELPWIKPWRTSGIGVPFNPVSKTQYRGVNFVTLGLCNGMDSQFVTAKQAFGLGGTVKKGSAHPILYFNFIKKEVEDATGTKVERKYALPKYFNVWNVNDVEGVDFDKPIPREIVINEFAEKLIKCAGVELIEGTDSSYLELTHQVTMPSRNKFINDDFYYGLMFHQLIHSTKGALKRNLGKNTEGEAFEELVAELGASMLCSHAGIDSFKTDHTAAYIQPWIKALEGDVKYIILAAQRAQKAVDYLLGKTFEEDAAVEAESLTV